MIAATSLWYVQILDGLVHYKSSVFMILAGENNAMYCTL